MDSKAVVAAVGLALGCGVLAYFATRSAGSLPKEGDASSLRTARGVLRRAGVAVAASAAVCLAAGLAAAASGRVFAPAETLLVGLAPQAGLCAAVLLPVPAPGAVGGALSPRRLRDLVPWPLLVAAAVVVVPGTLSAFAAMYVGAQPLGTPESNRAGFGCEVPAGPTAATPFSRPLDLGGLWWPPVQLSLMWLSGLVAVIGVRHCLRRPSVVPDAAVDSALRRCLAVRTSAAAALVMALAAGYAATSFSRGAEQVVANSRWHAQLFDSPSFRNAWPRLGECVLSDDVIAAWENAGNAVGWTMAAALVIAVWALACYVTPGRRRRRSHEPTDKVSAS